MTNLGFDQEGKNAQDNFRVLYICSSARCGSTLTDMFMGSHSQAASLGEINFLGKAISLNEECSCGDKLYACAHWRKVFNVICSSQGMDLTEDPYAFRLWDAVAHNKIDYQQQTRAHLAAVTLRKIWIVGRNYLPSNLRKCFPIPPTLSNALNNKMDLYRIISSCWDKSVIVDSSKDFREAVELHQRWPNIVKVLLLTRDGRGVYLSRRSSGRSQSESVNGWLNYYRRALPLLEKYIVPCNLLKIRYEDLASDPEKIGRILCDFVGISFEPLMLNLAQSTRHLAGGNNTRYFTNKGIRLDERWRTDLHGAELDFFERVGRDMNHRLGYIAK